MCLNVGKYPPSKIKHKISEKYICLRNHGMLWTELSYALDKFIAPIFVEKILVIQIDKDPYSK